jgi:glucose-6-phosphate dehydrogenase assembly protein OpcA
MLPGPMWRPSSPDSIEADLAAAWREAAREGPASRALMSNLVLVRRRGDAPETLANSGDAALAAAVARRHPARVVLLDYTPGVDAACAPTSAQIGIVTLEAPACRCGIEFIAVEAACAEASLPSIARRLTVGGVPTVVWWRPDLSIVPPPAAIIELGRQLVFDSAIWGDVRRGLTLTADLLSRANAPDVIDLNWRRLALLRGAIARALPPAMPPSAIGPRDVVIRYRPDQAALAALSEGWIRSAARWADTARPAVAADLTGDRLLEISLRVEPGAIVAGMTRDHVVASGPGGRPTWRAPRRENEAEAVADELQALGHHTGFRDAIRSCVRGGWPTGRMAQ